MSHGAPRGEAPEKPGAFRRFRSGGVMTTHLGNYFREHRQQRGLSLGQLARLAGDQNVSKGSNRIARFERQGAVKEDLLVALADALGIDLPTVGGLIGRDRRERLREHVGGGPFPRDVTLRNRATEAMRKAQPGTPLHRFNDSLARRADGNSREAHPEVRGLSARYNSGLRRLLVLVRIESALRHEVPVVCYVSVDTESDLVLVAGYGRLCSANNGQDTGDSLLTRSASQPLVKFFIAAGATECLYVAAVRRFLK